MKSRFNIYAFITFATKWINCLYWLRDNKLFKTVIPSKIFEYMATDNALILSMPKGETTKILNKGEFGVWVPPQTPKEFAQQIKLLYNNQNKVKEMAKQGKLLVKNYYNRNTLAMEMLNIIKNEIAKKYHAKTQQFF
jgi:spore maturation protein CgeB